MATLLTAVDDVPENGSYLFTVEEADGGREEVILVRLADGVSAWKNFCQHETDQRLDRGRGAAMREGQIICPKHGSMFDAETGYCDTGKAAGSTLVEVDVSVRHGQVYLTDDEVSFSHEGGIDDDGAPSSTSHLSF
ncbi:Rieske 2Fe-2S domain-containing protein [Natronomonas sp. CBA1123]|jgi:nitrite reductase/ring-hydroxylating ferredoxin subunit|uniref:Rieske (2Fe-2S) protein n=1 Tax=Natronomonas sp. CBA1123 TaxID=2668070 RepID=UPI0012EA332F|nr:Rieske 2Fe-2S domain-containing protein [Natronomonas sp. CBA1123]MUV87559.1 Rieske 2Fe-2S domain-containing protein [Natronomonas sp. CBA1123]